MFNACCMKRVCKGFNFCCMKRVCDGCVEAANQRGMGDNCEFCRTPIISEDDDASALVMVQKRADAGDAEATNYLACLLMS